jgi:MFS family permease
MSGEFKRNLVSSFNADLIIPIYSVLLPLLAYNLGASGFEIGLVGGVVNAVYCFMPLVMGRIADRGGIRKLFVTSSFVILSVVSISYVFVQNPVVLIVTRVFEGIGWAMLWPAIESAIRDSMPDGKKALSIFNFTWSGAAAVGPLVGLALIFFTTVRDAFVVTSAIMLATFVLNLAPLRTEKSQSVVSPYPPPTSTVSTYQPDSGFGAKLFLPSMALAAVSSGVLYTFMGAYAKSIDLSAAIVWLATFMFGFARFLVYVLSVRERFRSVVLNREKRTRNVVLTLVIMSISSLLILIHDASGAIYIVVYGVAGAGYSIVYAISQAVMIAEAHPAKVGRRAGMFESSIGIGQFLGPVIGGAISDHSLSNPFIVPTLSLIVFLVALPSMARKRNSF